MRSRGMRSFSGMSKVIESATDQSATITLTKSRSMRWLAPELLEGSRLTTACDVYSFSMTMLECITLKDPFHDIKRDFLIARQLSKGVKPEKPDLTVLQPYLKGGDTGAMWEVMQICWTSNPDQRPAMIALSQQLMELSI